MTERPHFFYGRVSSEDQAEDEQGEQYRLRGVDPQ